MNEEWIEVEARRYFAGPDVLHGPLREAYAWGAQDALRRAPPATQPSDLREALQKIVHLTHGGSAFMTRRINAIAFEALCALNPSDPQGEKT